jgi:hypothetical protein
VVEFRFDPQGIIDHHFTGQKHHREIISEGPCLNHVRQRLRQGFSLVQSRQIFFGMVCGGPGGTCCQFLPIVVRRQGVVRKLDCL